MTSLRPDLSGTVALVTGGGRGLGRIVAHQLATAGAVVAVSGRSKAHLTDVVREIEAEGGAAFAVPMDITNPDDVSEGVAAAQDACGAINLLVNNAGVGGPMGPVWEVDQRDWWYTVEVNLRGVMLCSAAVLPSMVERRSGRVVNVVSHAGVFRWPNVSAYSTSKAAVIKLTENQAYEARKHGITFFAVHPGLTPIGLSEGVLGDDMPEEFYEAQMAAWLRKQFDEGNMVPPECGARLIARIASGEADALSGRYLRADKDLEPLLADAEKIVVDDRLMLRLRT